MSQLVEEVLLPFSGQKPRMVLNILQCTGQPPQQKTVQWQMSVALRLGIPALEIVMGRNVRLKCFFGKMFRTHMKDYQSFF